MQLSEYRNLVNHMEWADAQVWTSILSKPLLENDDWIKERMHHYHSTQWAYGQIIFKLPINIPELRNFADINSIGCWASCFYKEFSDMFSKLDEIELQEKVEFPWSTRIAEKFGSISPANVGESIIQLALHSTHHRGQVVMHLREAGIEPPMTDFIAWIWMRCPKASWNIHSAA
jgi:hypothetical protein